MFLCLTVHLDFTENICIFRASALSNEENTKIMRYPQKVSLKLVRAFSYIFRFRLVPMAIKTLCVGFIARHNPVQKSNVQLARST